MLKNKYFILFVLFVFVGIAPAFGDCQNKVQNFWYPLHTAVDQGDLELTQIYIDMGFDINQRMPEEAIRDVDCDGGICYWFEGMTPLEMAISRIEQRFDDKHLQIVLLLLEKGADPYSFRRRRFPDWHEYKFFSYDTFVSQIFIYYCMFSTNLVKDGCLLPNPGIQNFCRNVIEKMIVCQIDLNQICDKTEFPPPREGYGRTPYQIVNDIESIVQECASRGCQWKNMSDVLGHFELMKQMLLDAGVKPQ